MEKGKIKWFNPKKGYGFIIQEKSNKDLFFHITSLQKGTTRNLTEGQPVTFEITESQGQSSAQNITLPS